MHARKGYNEMKKPMKTESVKIRTSDGSVLIGDVNLLAGEGVNRLSELFTKESEPFIVLFNAMQQGKPGQTFVVNKNHIIWVLLNDD